MAPIYIRIAYPAVAGLFYLFGYWHESAGNNYTIGFFHNWPNAISVVICSALMGALYAKHRNANVVGVTIGLIIYEVLQLWIPERTFDWLDILASIFGMGLYLTVYHQLFRRITKHIDWCKQCKTAT